MGIPGLTSVTFRALPAERVAKLCAAAGLAAIEWGGDVHVPPGDEQAARAARAVCQSLGLLISSYGSYYRAGQPIGELARCLDAAAALGAPIVRIWAGQAGSADVDPGERARLVDCLLRCAEIAEARSIRLGLEYHGGTLTDCRDSVRALARETAGAADWLRFYWQPRWDWPETERLESLGDVRGRLAHIHAFTWAHRAGAIDRLPLAAGESTWRAALRGLPADQMVLLEFVEGDSEQALLRDAAALRRLMDM